MTRATRIRPPAGAVLAGLLVSACTAPAPQPPAPHLEGTAWILASLPAQALPPTAPRPTLRFDGPRVSGSDGCNRFVGSWSVAGDTLRIGRNLASTQRACGEPIEAIAQAYGRALARASTWRIDDSGLVLVADGGAEIATFERQPTGLVATTWRVVAHHDGRQSIVSVREASRLGLEFGAGGVLRGTGGCNAFTGRWTQQADRVAIDDIVPTTRRCAQPPDLMQQEAAFLRALKTAALVRREGERLELRDDSGALAVIATASAGPRP
jgi:heat shock protein HslJ